MFLLFLITVHLNARIPEKLVFWTVSYTYFRHAFNSETLINVYICMSKSAN